MIMSTREAVADKLELDALDKDTLLYFEPFPVGTRVRVKRVGSFTMDDDKIRTKKDDPYGEFYGVITGYYPEFITIETKGKLGSFTKAMHKTDFICKFGRYIMEEATDEIME